MSEPKGQSPGAIQAKSQDAKQWCGKSVSQNNQENDECKDAIFLIEIGDVQKSPEPCKESLFFE